MTLIENITPENPMEHSCPRYGTGHRGFYATLEAFKRAVGVRGTGAAGDLEASGGGGVVARRTLLGVEEA
jgi:hypothetical protein